MSNFPVLAILFLITTACSSAMVPKITATKPPKSGDSFGAVREPAETRGLAFGRQHCSGCHAVSAGQSSPNVEAPTFEAVVNTPGLTAATIKPWLRDSHNFPAMMNFTIDPDQIDDLAAYMMTLQRGDYVPPI